MKWTEKIRIWLNMGIIWSAHVHEFFMPELRGPSIVGLAPNTFRKIGSHGREHIRWMGVHVVFHSVKTW